MNKKRWYKIIVLGIIFIIIILTRIQRKDNSIYIKLFSDEKLIFHKHIAHSSILKKFREINKSKFGQVTCFVEKSDCLLYTDNNDVFRIITLKDNIVEDSIYRPNFRYEIDGEYINFVFEDQFLNYVDEIIMQQICDENEINLYTIPISTNIPMYSAIIKIKELNNKNLENCDFKIKYALYYGDYWNQIVMMKNQNEDCIVYCK